MSQLVSSFFALIVLTSHEAAGREGHTSDIGDVVFVISTKIDNPPPYRGVVSLVDYVASTTKNFKRIEKLQLSRVDVVPAITVDDEYGIAYSAAYTNPGSTRPLCTVEFKAKSLEATKKRDEVRSTKAFCRKSLRPRSKNRKRFHKKRKLIHR